MVTVHMFELLGLVTCLTDYLKAQHAMNRNSLYSQEAAQEVRWVDYISPLLCKVFDLLHVCLPNITLGLSSVIIIM
jgi:hypothetical protein